MNKKILISRLFSFVIFGLFGLSIISCEDISGLPSDLSTEISSELSEGIPEHIHEWNDGKVTKEATCIEDGEMTYTCSSCDEIKFETIAALGHNEVIDEAVAPTCTTTGLTEGKHCSTCNEVLVSQEVVDELGHNYTLVVTNPTCVDQGYTTHTCENCKDSYVDTYTDALGHDYILETTTNPTCVEQGYITHTCENCKDSYVDTYTDALGHDYTLEVITKPTCVEQGYTTHTCSRCDDSYDDSYVKALGHDEVVDKAVAPTCTDTGLTKGSHCDRCNEVLVVQEVVKALGHDYDSVVTKPTCNEQGYTTHTCSRCDDSYVDSYVKALGHVEIIDFAIAPTCTETGLTEGKHCDRCKEVLVAQEEVTALGHDYDSVVTEPTCVEQGYTTHTCSRCDNSYVDNYVNALGHSFSEWNVTLEPECESVGTKRRDCEACNHYEEEEIAALGHVEIIDKAVAPTCTETGLTQGSHCDRCKEVFVEQEVVPARHNFIDYICSECGYEYYSEGLVFTDYGGYYAVTAIGTATDTEIVIPSTYNELPVKIIESYAFKDCSSLKKVTIGTNVNWIGDFSFSGCDSLASITISDSVTEIGCYAFEMCSSLTSIEIPESVKTINTCAFYYCVSLESITMSNSVTRIGDSAFWCCESLTYIIIPDSVKNIHNYTFFGCNSLTSITISNSVRNFGNHSFDGCSSLKEVYYTGTEEQWNIINIGTDNEYLTNATIHFAKEDINYTEELIYELSSDETYYAVIDIGTLTDSNIIIPETYNGLPVKRIEFEAFCYCSWLTNVTIGNNVTSIESYAFIGCSSLTSITIPDSVINVLDYAFSGCTSLTDIYYSGTEEQWKSIIIGTENEYLTNATIHYNYSE